MSPSVGTDAPGRPEAVAPTMSAMEKSDLPVGGAEAKLNRGGLGCCGARGAKGRGQEAADLQSTVRTQSREAVSQAQALPREAVIRNTRQGKLTAASASHQHRRFASEASPI